MALNSYFNQFTNTVEQGLLDELIVESIQIYGHLVYYIPRNVGNRDDIFFEDAISTYSTNYAIEVYINATEGYGGEQDIFSKFGLEIRDTFEVQVAKTTFQNLVGTPASKPQPMEGDLIYFPMSNDLFKITFTEDEPVFYQLGSLHLYELKLEKYEYSNEVFNTGIAALDAWVNEQSHDIGLFNILTEAEEIVLLQNGAYLVQEEFNIVNIDPLAQNDIFQQTANGFLDFSESDPFAEGGRV